MPDRPDPVLGLIDHFDRQIDQFVYKLYGFTHAEIRLVNEVTA